MADTAFQTQYRQEFIAGFEQRQSLLRNTVTYEAVIKGNQATFLVADSNDATTVTRGVNGLIPANVDNVTQLTATLSEEHDLRKRTSFNIFASQGDGRKILQENSMAVFNRKIDAQILGELANATYTTGASVTASVDLTEWAATILGNNAVPMDGNISAVISRAFLAYLRQAPEFSSADFVNDKPFTDQPQMFRWSGVNWIVHPKIVGTGTSTELCYMYHKNAIGQAMDTAGMTSVVGYQEEQDYSYARTSGFMGSKLLQAKGIVLMRHDGSKYASV